MSNTDQTPSKTRPLLAPLLLLLAACGVWTSACAPAERSRPDEPIEPPPKAVPVVPPAQRFLDVSAEVGLDFVHDNGMSGERYFVEPVGSGGAMVDLDDDGDLDLVLIQGRPLSPSSEAGSESEEVVRGSRIYRNDLEPDGHGRLRPKLIDITEQSGFRADGYGMGIATGDFDNDGRIDLYVTNFGPNQLWRNVSGDGRIALENVTADAGNGVDDARWSTSAAFTDFDGDGFLDLVVINYVDFRLETHRPCRSAGGRPDYCGPQSYDGEPDRLLWNRGDGTFVDITGIAGLLDEPSSGLGVTAADFDDDGRMDLYVANDLRRNFLWQNLGPGADGPPRFENVALERGAAVSMLGRAQASMGVVAGDLDSDGDEDLFMTHLSADTNTLYANDGRGFFIDRSTGSGLGPASLEATGFGVALVDIELDGRLDVVVANGAVKVIESLAKAGDPYPLKQPNQLFHNRGQGNFVELGAAAGEAFGRLEVSRGIAVGDVDNDGRLDLLLTNNHGPARLLLAAPFDNDGAWIGLRLLTAERGRDALGARVDIVLRNGTVLRRRVATDGGYLSAGDPRLAVGLGHDPEIAEVRVRWPGGGEEIFTNLAPGSYHNLVAGQGRSAASAPYDSTAEPTAGSTRSPE